MTDEKAKAPRKKQPAYKTLIGETTLKAALADGISEIESLRDEMQETLDNMDGMEHLPKYEATEAAHNALEEVLNNGLDGATDTLDEIEEDDPKVAFSESVPTRKGRPPGRSVRLANATSLLQPRSIHVEGLEDAAEEDENRAETRAQLQDVLETAISEAENVEFPGMYG